MAAPTAPTLRRLGGDERGIALFVALMADAPAVRASASR